MADQAWLALRHPIHLSSCEETRDPAEQHKQKDGQTFDENRGTNMTRCTQQPFEQQARDSMFQLDNDNKTSKVPEAITGRCIL